MRVRLRLALGVALTLLAAVSGPGFAGTEDSPVAAASGPAIRVLEQVRPSVVQIRGFYGNNTAKAFHGTGFVVAAGGVLVTNYHVVADLVQSPEIYRLDYLAADGRTGAVAILAVDVQNDLAIVKAEGFDARPLPLARQPLPKGSRAYSIGYPLDVGLTITEGIANGIVEDNFIDRIHYSGAINGGMSGGPALNDTGELIGVNVSGYRFEQLVSFLVPAAAVAHLVEAIPTAAPTVAAIAKTVDDQLHRHSEALLGAFTGKIETEATSGYRLPAKLAPFVDCSAEGSSGKSDSVQYVRISCQAKAGLYLQSRLYSGDITYSHGVLHSATLGTWRFANRLSDWAATLSTNGSPEHVGPFSCHDDMVALVGFQARISLCTRNYRKLANLYDIVLNVVSLSDNTKGFMSELSVLGVDYEPGMAFVRRYLEAMELAP